MTPEKLEALNDLILKQTGKSIYEMDDGDLENFLSNMEARANNELILANAFKEMSDSDGYAVKLWRQVVPMNEICERSGLSPDQVESAVGSIVENLRKAHFLKFCKGWKLDASGEPVSANPPVETDTREAQIEFDKWMIVLALKSP